MNSVRIRPARTEDKEPVLAFTANTFQWGDYIHWVWDEWLHTPNGELTVAEVDGAVVAMTMTIVLSTGEGWLQGLRVHPDYRRHGLGRQIMAYQLDVCRRFEASVARLAVHCLNVASQTLVAQAGFRRLATFAHLENKPSAIADGGERSEALAPDDAPAAWRTIARSPTLQSCAGLWARGWEWQKLTPEILAECAAQRRVYGVRSGDEWGALAVALREEDGLHVGYVDGSGLALDDLAHALARQARNEGLEWIAVMTPPVPHIGAAFRQAGYTSDSEGDSMYVYEIKVSEVALAPAVVGE
jgi:ribosomal protein S18 acetylase RimI-like enzyme